MGEREIRRGAGGPYSVVPGQFKGLQYAVKDREDTTVHVTRSRLGAERRRDRLHREERQQREQNQRQDRG